MSFAKHKLHLIYMSKRTLKDWIGKEKESSEYDISARAWIVLLILGLSVLIAMYGETMLLPAIPDIINEFNISYNTSSWILTAYLISGAVMTPIAGKLSDIYGKKKMVLIILIVYIIGVAIGAWSPDFYIMMASRIIQGIGISMFPIAFGIIRELFPPEKLAIGVGIFSSMFAAGSVVGLALGGTIVEHLGWHATFFSILPFAIILWFTINKFIHNMRPPISNSNPTNIANDIGYPKTNGSVSGILDIKGAILLTITITSFLLAITFIGNSQSIQEVAIENSAQKSDPFGSPFYIFLLLTAITLVSLVFFILVEKKSLSPLIDLRLFGNKILLISNILVVTLGLSMFIVYQTIPFLVRSPQPVGFGGDAIEAAMVQLPFMIIFLIFAPTSGFIISKIGSIKPVLLGTIISLAGFISMFTFHDTEILVSVNLAIISVGFSLLNTGIFNIILTSTPIQFSGVSLGMTVVINIIGMSVGPIVAGFFMQSFQVMSIESSYPSSTAYNMIFLIGIVISACSVGLSLILRKNIQYSKSNMGR